MRYLSLFSGIEAASAAWKPLGWECVGFSEIEPFPTRLLAARHPGVPNLGDVTKITEADIAMLGHIDLIVFGSPCQDLSVAGKQKGLAGERSGLFFSAMRIIGWAREWCDLRGALWENVPGAFSSNKGADFAAVVGALAGLECAVPPKGWGTEGCAVGSEAMVEWCVLDAQWFGVAQRRRRVFALADFGDWSRRPPILLEPEGLRGDSAPRRGTGEEVAGTLAARTEVSGFPGSDEAMSGYVQRVRGPVLSRGSREVAGSLTSSYGKQPDSSDTALGPNLVILEVMQVANTLNAGGHSRNPLGETLLAYMPTRTFGADGGINEHFAPRDICDALHTSSGSGNKAPIVCVTGQVTHALTVNGFDASEDGTGRGNPIIAFSCKDYGNDATLNVAPTMRAMGHSGSHANAGGQLAVAFDTYNQSLSPVSHTLRDPNGTFGDALPAVWSDRSVRRLTVEECESLQGFPRGYTAIPSAADGPRYKALGNSMAVPVMNWIGRQIDYAWSYF